MRFVVILMSALMMGCASHWVSRKGGEVALYLKAPDATEVIFYCSLDGYAPRRATEVRNGVWRAELPVDRGCRYFYRIDGEMVAPPCHQREFDDFGGENCLYAPVAWGTGGEK